MANSNRQDALRQDLENRLSTLEEGKVGRTRCSLITSPYTSDGIERWLFQSNDPDRGSRLIAGYLTKDIQAGNIYVFSTNQQKYVKPQRVININYNNREATFVTDDNEEIITMLGNRCDTLFIRNNVKLSESNVCRLYVPEDIHESFRRLIDNQGNRATNIFQLDTKLVQEVKNRHLMIIEDNILRTVIKVSPIDAVLQTLSVITEDGQQYTIAINQICSQPSFPSINQVINQDTIFRWHNIDCGLVIPQVYYDRFNYWFKEYHQRETTATNVNKELLKIFLGAHRYNLVYYFSISKQRYVLVDNIEDVSVESNDITIAAGGNIRYIGLDSICPYYGLIPSPVKEITCLLFMPSNIIQDLQDLFTRQDINNIAPNLERTLQNLIEEGLIYYLSPATQQYLLPKRIRINVRNKRLVVDFQHLADIDFGIQSICPIEDNPDLAHLLDVQPIPLDEVAQVALNYGFIPIPLQGDKPSIRQWQRTTAKTALRKIKDATNADSIGIITGQPSGIVILVVNQEGKEQWENLLRRHGEIETFTVQGPNGLRQYYFNYDNLTSQLKKTSSKLQKQGFDIKGDSNYIPFIQSSDEERSYTPINGLNDETGEIFIADMPQWLITFLQS